MPEIRGVNPLEDDNWDEWLSKISGCSFFHTSNWIASLSKAYNYKPVYFTAGGANKITDILPLAEVRSLITGRRGVSLPFTDFCEPIASDKERFQELFAAAVAYGKKQKWRYLEFRGGETFFPGEQAYAWHYGHTLDLTPGISRIYDNLRDSNRRNIRKSEKNNITVSFLVTPAALAEFCRLNVMTRREHGLPPQPQRFFQSVYENIMLQGRGFIALAYWQKEVIAANIYFHFGDELIYKYGASNRKYQDFRANNLIMWEAIKRGCEQSFRTLHFGRTEPENKGLLQFKAGWGTRQFLIKYYRYDLRRNAFSAGSSDVNPNVKKLFQKMPLPALKIIGRLLYRHMG